MVFFVYLTDLFSVLANGGLLGLAADLTCFLTLKTVLLF